MSAYVCHVRNLSFPGNIEGGLSGGGCQRGIVKRDIVKSGVVRAEMLQCSCYRGNYRGRLLERGC